MQDAFESGQLRFAGRLQALSDPRRFAQHLRPARETEWVVYARPPFAGPEQVLDYLGRYTHRIAIGNQRLCSLQDGSVRFRYTDYRRTGASRQKTMTRPLSTPPPPPAEQAGRAATDYRDRYEALTGRSLRRCPRCDDGNMLVVDHLAGKWVSPAILDSS